jgi:hypothetical protein
VEEQEAAFQAREAGAGFEARRDARLSKGAVFSIPESQLPSSFKSHEISRLYSSKTTVKVEYGGKKHKVIFKILELKVLPLKARALLSPNL